MFIMESKHSLNLSVQNASDCLSENFNLKTFPGACARNSLEKCAVRSPDVCYRAHILIASVYYISGPPLSQNPPSAPGKIYTMVQFLPPISTFLSFH